MTGDRDKHIEQVADAEVAGSLALSRLRLRQSILRGVVVAGGILVLGVAVWVAWVIVDPQGAPTREPVVLEPSDVLEGLDQDMRDRLVAGRPDQPARFKRVFGGQPEDLCAEIDRLGVPMSSWALDPFVAGFWYCASDLAQIGPETEDGRRSTLFVNLRGENETALHTARIKLSADNPNTVGAARASLFRILDAIGTRYGWPWPRALEEAVREGRALDRTEFGLRIRVLPEDPSLTDDGADVQRLNVILTFPVLSSVEPGELTSPFAWDDRANERRRARPLGGATLLPEP